MCRRLIGWNLLKDDMKLGIPPHLRFRTQTYGISFTSRHRVPAILNLLAANWSWTEESHMACREMHYPHCVVWMWQSMSPWHEDKEETRQKDLAFI